MEQPVAVPFLFCLYPSTIRWIGANIFPVYTVTPIVPTIVMTPFAVGPAGLMLPGGTISTLSRTLPASRRRVIYPVHSYQTLHPNCRSLPLPSV